MQGTIEGPGQVGYNDGKNTMISSADKTGVKEGGATGEKYPNKYVEYRRLVTGAESGQSFSSVLKNKQAPVSSRSFSDSAIGQGPSRESARTSAPHSQAHASRPADPLLHRTTTQRLAYYRPLIQHMSTKYRLDPHLVAAVIHQESGGKLSATSPCGAMGLMQLMPQTARAMGVKNPYNPVENVEGGCRYLRNMLNKFDGNTDLALAAYNAGPEAVVKNGYRIPPYQETQNYVPAVKSHARALMVAGLFTPQSRGVRFIPV